MSRPNDRPWTEEEKVYLLTEILKISHVHSSNLLELIDKFNVHPRWDDIPLPQGRPLRSCQNAFEEMRQTRRNLQRAGSQVTPSYATYGTATPFAPPTSLPQLQPGPVSQRKRPFHDLEPAAAATPPGSRMIQPRPPISGQIQPFTTFSGTESVSTIQSPSEAGDEPARKKRGRPSKDEIQRREAEAAARGEVYAPKKRPPRKSAETAATPSRSESMGPPVKTEASRLALYTSPKMQPEAPPESRVVQQTQASSDDPMDTTSPPRSAAAASTPGPPAESRPFSGYQSSQTSSESTHFVHRPSSSAAPSPVPRYQPSLAPANPPPPESSGTGMPSTYPSLYDTQAQSRP